MKILQKIKMKLRGKQSVSCKNKTSSVPTEPNSVSTDRNDARIDFGMIRSLPYRSSSGHFLLVGSPMSGKTVFLTKLMQSILTKENSPLRALVYDGKRELYPTVKSICGKNGRRVILMNPMDSRSVAWDIAADTKGTTSAKNIAACFYPSGSYQGPSGAGHSQDFWDKAARNLLSSILITLGKLAPGKWTLSDVINVNRDFRNRLLPFLKLHRKANQKALTYLADPETVRMALSMLASLNEQLDKFEAIAGIWSRCPVEDRVSLDDWVANQESVLVFGSTPSSSESVDPINKVMIERIYQLILSKDENCPDHSWMFLDELRAAPRLEGTGKFLSQARAMGGRWVGTFQTISGMRDLYGEHLCDELAGMPENKMMLRMRDEKTDEWARKQFGAIQWGEWADSVTQGENGISTNSSFNRVERSVLLDGHFSQLPVARKTTGFHARFIITELGEKGHYPASQPYDEVIKSLPKKEDLAKWKKFILRPWQDEEVDDWNEADLNRLNLTGHINLEFSEPPEKRKTQSSSPSTPIEEDNYTGILDDLKRQDEETEEGFGILTGY